MRAIDCGFALMVTDATPPTGNVPKSHETTPDEVEQLPWLATALTIAVFAGSVSESTGLVAGFGPLFEIVNEYVTLFPKIIGSTMGADKRARSIGSVQREMMLALLFVGLRSISLPATDAELLITPN